MPNSIASRLEKLLARRNADNLRRWPWFVGMRVRVKEGEYYAGTVGAVVEIIDSRMGGRKGCLSVVFDEKQYVTVGDERIPIPGVQWHPSYFEPVE